MHAMLNNCNLKSMSLIELCNQLTPLCLSKKKKKKKKKPNTSLCLYRDIQNLNHSFSIIVITELSKK